MVPIAEEEQLLMRGFAEGFENHLDIVFRLDAAKAHAILLCLEAIVLQDGLGVGRGDGSVDVVAAVGNVLRVDSIFILNIFLDGGIVGNDNVGIFHGLLFGIFQKSAHPRFPFVAAMLQAVDVDNQTLFGEKAEYWEE